ncbi:Crp/Fnr family transcriptional regulator [Flaviflexus salsibiostraticola]|uniref:Crp/Fnr family transcriptional regulator n=1 Tax=Flaviflexus salsibiostraticola TaxID=1282737 RepID=A0A3Q8WT30_9ACTO|nr:Crp/Fnr family transcriptional regulator [Flaviflexus salsibiostraticola]AZN29527.1 Crp/Fnr family transcriptional regulator [Flaviflexus salsibiostraticola]
MIEEKVGVSMARSPVTKSAGEPHQCSEETRLRVLRAVKWFRDLSDDEIDAISREITSHAWSPGEYLQIEGDHADALHVIAQGMAKVEKVSADGTTRIVDIAVPGDLVGVLPQLGAPVYTDSVATLSVTCALRIEAERFTSIMLTYPTVAVNVVDDLAHKLARSRHSETHGSRPVPQRLADVLLMLMRKVGRRDEEGILIDLPLSRVDLAAMAGSTPESVSRTMSRWKAQGIIDSGRRWTRVLRPRDIQELATA